MKDKELTAVEYLVSKLFDSEVPLDEHIYNAIEEAKEMEKEQQFSDYMRGWDDGYQNKVKNSLNDNPKQQEQ